MDERYVSVYLHNIISTLVSERSSSNCTAATRPIYAVLLGYSEQVRERTRISVCEGRSYKKRERNSPSANSGILKLAVLRCLLSYRVLDVFVVLPGPGVAMDRTINSETKTCYWWIKGQDIIAIMPKAD